MPNLKDQPLCTHPNADECIHYVSLLYRSVGATYQLPDGYAPAPCDFCEYKLRYGKFFDKKEW